MIRISQFSPHQNLACEKLTSHLSPLFHFFVTSHTTPFTSKSTPPILPVDSLSTTRSRHYGPLLKALARSYSISQVTPLSQIFSTRPTKLLTNASHKLHRPHSPPKLVSVTDPPPPSLSKKFPRPKFLSTTRLSLVTHSSLTCCLLSLDLVSLVTCHSLVTHSSLTRLKLADHLSLSRRSLVYDFVADALASLAHCCLTPVFGPGRSLRSRHSSYYCFFGGGRRTARSARAMLFTTVFFGGGARFARARALTTAFVARALASLAPC